MKPLSRSIPCVIRRLNRIGYLVKHCGAGWFVDGLCGYMVTGYHPTKAQAVRMAVTIIKDCQRHGGMPSWRYMEELR